MSEQERALIQGCEGLENKEIRERGRLDIVRQGEIKGVDDHGVREDGSVCIILSDVYVVLVREGISRSHLCSWSNIPDDVKVLKEERPASLASRKFARVLQVGKVFMVNEDRDRVRSALQVLLLFCKGKDDSQEFMIIDVIVLLCCRKGFGEIHTGVQVTWSIWLHENCTHHEKRSIGHKGE